MEIKYKNIENIRADNYLIDILNMSRTKIQKMIKFNVVKVNDKIIKNSYILKNNDVITIGEYIEEVQDIKPEKMDLDIVYEDNDVLVINKKNGIVVHPANGNYSNTLVNGLMYYSKLSDINGEFRPGIVHRIDA
ncbi:MAG: RluA family pseudouridine synthase, partial [Bacilli bacterium]